jgi:hypothetical protein
MVDPNFVEFAFQAYIGTPLPNGWISLSCSNTYLCRQQAHILQNHGNVNVRDIVQREAQH